MVKKALKEPIPVAKKVKKAVAKKAKAKAARKQSETTVVESSPPQIIDAATYAGIKRVAGRNNIACISTDCIVAVQSHITERLLEFLLLARSNAYYMSGTRTTHSKDLASAARTLKMGDLVCV